MAVQFKHATLDNGLTLIAEVNDQAHTAAGGFFINVGTRDETSDIMGVSHFLEHMMFKGTDRRTADDVNRDFDRIGANYNAFTSNENTAYFAQVLPEYLPRALDVLSDIMRPTLRGEDFEMEKNVILEEIGMYMDRPFWVAYEHAMEQFFGGHSLGYRVLGTNHTITDLGRDAMADYFQHRYSPDNMVLALAGRLDFDAVVEQIGEACGHWPATGAQRQYQPDQPTRTEQTLHDAKLTNHYLVSVMPGPSNQDDRRYAATVLANVLGDADGSRLYWKLIDPGLADEAEFAHHGFDRAGTFLAFASCPPANAQAVEAGLFEVIDTAGKGLTAGEVERSANKLAMSLTLTNERPMGRMMALGGRWLYEQAYRPLEEELQRLMAVNVDQIRELLDSFDLSRRTVVRCSPPPAGSAPPHDAGASA